MEGQMYKNSCLLSSKVHGDASCKHDVILYSLVSINMCSHFNCLCFISACEKKWFGPDIHMMFRHSATTCECNTESFGPATWNWLSLVILHWFDGAWSEDSPIMCSWTICCHELILLARVLFIFTFHDDSLLDTDSGASARTARVMTLRTTIMFAASKDTFLSEPEALGSAPQDTNENATSWNGPAAWSNLQAEKAGDDDRASYRAYRRKRYFPARRCSIPVVFCGMSDSALSEFSMFRIPPAFCCFMIIYPSSWSDLLQDFKQTVLCCETLCCGCHVWPCQDVVERK